MGKDKLVIEASVFFTSPKEKNGKVTSRHAFWVGEHDIAERVAHMLNNLIEVVVNFGRHVTGFETRVIR